MLLFVAACFTLLYWPVHRRLPPASTYYCSSTIDFLQPPPATVHPWGSCSSSLHRLLFIQPSMASCSSSLHRLLFNQPSTGSCSSSLHRLLFNQPSLGSCSTSPPWGPVQLALTDGVPPPVTIHPPPRLLDRGPVYPAATASTTMGSFSSNPTGNCSSNPPAMFTVHPEAASVGFS